METIIGGQVYRYVLADMFEKNAIRENGSHMQSKLSFATVQPNAKPNFAFFLWCVPITIYNRD